MIQTQIKKDIITNDIGNTTKMSIALDEANQAHIVKVLSENYKYPIASTIREAASNAWDSHLMNNTPEKPFHVRFYENETQNYNLEIEDFGLGLDKEGFYKYYMQIGNSTKRGVAGVLGFFGAGCKAALSIEGLTNYEVICRKDGVENKFLIFKGETFPESLPLHELPTEEGNGVLIRIPISYRDRYTAIEAIKEQLCYFKTACIQIQGDDTNYLEKRIYENDLFSWSEVYPSNEMHINFGGVHYAIDWDILKIKKINIPIGIKIAPDNGINPFFNRESLDYTTLCKETILNRIKEVAEYFVNRYNETNIVFKDFFELYNYYGDSSKYVTIENKTFCIDSLLSYSSISLVKPIYPGVTNLDLEQFYLLGRYLLQDYNVVARIDYNRISYKDKSKVKIFNEIPKFFITPDLKKVTIDYLKETHKNCEFVKKVSTTRLGNKDSYKCYYNFLNLKNYPKSLWRTLIQEWQLVENDLLNKLIKDIPEVPKNWIEARKAERKVGTRTSKAEGEINFKIARSPSKSSDKICIFESNIINLKNLDKTNKFIVYGNEEARDKLSLLFEIQKSNRKEISIALVGLQDYKKLENVKIHNLVKMEDFLKEKHKALARYATNYKISKLLNKYPFIYDQLKFIRKNISKSFADKLQKLYSYKLTYKTTENELLVDIEKFCDDLKFYDYSIYDTYLEVAKDIEKLSFIKYFITGSNWSKHIDEEATPIIKELLVARKFKMDLNQYEKVVSPEITETEEQEVLEELND